VVDSLQPSKLGSLLTQNQSIGVQHVPASTTPVAKTLIQTHECRLFFSKKAQ
jgi:hypothetical protein